MPNSSVKDKIALHPTPIQIGQCELPLSHRAPKKPDTAAPSSGSSGISQANLMANRCSMNCYLRFDIGGLRKWVIKPPTTNPQTSSFQFAPRLRVERVFLAEQQDDQPQRQRRLGRRDHQDEDHKCLPAEIPVI